MEQEFYSEVNSVSCGLGELARTSSIRNSFRRQRDPIWIQNVRLQLAEQAKCLESRLDSHVSMLKELFDFFKKRAEVERDYSNSMDKLVQQALNRHEKEKQRHEVWSGYSTYTMWQTFLETTRKLSKDHQTLADIYGGQLYPQLTELSEDLQRMYKKCRTFLTISHEDLVRVLTDLQSAMKTYQEYQSQCFEAETKLKRVQTQKLKLEQVQTRHSKSTNKRKFQSLEKQMDKKRTKFSDCHLRVVRSRNEYILNLASANSALQKYFSEDIHNEINTMDYGFHFVLSQIALTQISAEQNMIDSRQGCLQILKQKVKNLEQPKDKQIFIDLFPRQFSVPDKFEFHAHKGDDMMKELIVENSLMKDEMNQRMKTLQNRLDSLESENEEMWKSVEDSECKLFESLPKIDPCVDALFEDGKEISKHSMMKLSEEKEKLHAERIGLESLYLSKYHNYQSNKGIVSRLFVKHSCIENALANNSLLRSADDSRSVIQLQHKKTKKADLSCRPKLFGGSIEEYVKVTKESIPTIIRSCIRIIKLYGIQQQGIFRIPGSQYEINELKELFESGEDPLAEDCSIKDINSIAGVLKLYFRELPEPLFPFSLFDNFMSLVGRSSPQNFNEIIAEIRQILETSSSKSSLVIMRHLFAFLNHLSEFSDENLMDPYNLSICFGPTLLPMLDDRDQHQFQNHINELIRCCIIHWEDIFPLNDKGSEYEKCEAIDDTSDEELLDVASGNDDSDTVTFTDDDEKCLEGRALYDYQGRTSCEVSFKKDDPLLLYKRVSIHWWHGSVRREGVVVSELGLIPDGYIEIQHSGKKCRKKKPSSGRGCKRLSLPIKLAEDGNESAQNKNRFSNVVAASSSTRSSPTKSVNATPEMPRTDWGTVQTPIDIMEDSEKTVADDEKSSGDLDDALAELYYEYTSLVSNHNRMNKGDPICEHRSSSGDYEEELAPAVDPPAVRPPDLVNDLPTGRSVHSMLSQPSDGSSFARRKSSLSEESCPPASSIFTKDAPEPNLIAPEVSPSSAISSKPSPFYSRRISSVTSSPSTAAKLIKSFSIPSPPTESHKTQLELPENRTNSLKKLPQRPFRSSSIELKSPSAIELRRVGSGLNGETGDASESITQIATAAAPAAAVPAANSSDSQKIVKSKPPPVMKKPKRPVL